MNQQSIIVVDGGFVTDEIRKESRRFSAAIAALQGLLSNCANDPMKPHEYASDAVLFADALLERLEKNE